MRSNINLAESKSEGKQSKLFNKISILRFIAIGLLFFVALASITLFVFIAQSPLPQLQNEEQAVSQTLSAQQQDLAKIMLVNERGKVASEILTKRQAYDVMIDKVRNKMPPGVTVLSFSVSNNNISITVASRSLAALDGFVDKLTEATGDGKEFSRVVLGELSIDQDMYLMKIDIVTL